MLLLALAAGASAQDWEGVGISAGGQPPVTQAMVPPAPGKGGLMPAQLPSQFSIPTQTPSQWSVPTQTPSQWALPAQVPSQWSLPAQTAGEWSAPADASAWTGSAVDFQPAPSGMELDYASGDDSAYAPDSEPPDDSNAWANPGSPGSTCDTRRAYYPRRQQYSRRSYTWSQPRWYDYNHRGTYPRYQTYRWPSSYGYGYRSASRHRPAYGWTTSYAPPLLPYAWRDRGYPGYGYYSTSCWW